MRGRDDDAPPAREWRHLVERHAERSGVPLPSATVDELASHLEDTFDACRRAGMEEEEACRRTEAVLAAAELTVLSRHAARHPQSRRARRADAEAALNRSRRIPVAHTLRMALRQLHRHRRFALVTVLVLGLGTAAATTVFTIVDSVVLRPLPYAEPDRLVALWDVNVEQGDLRDPLSPVNFMDQRALPVFADAAAWWRPAVNLVDPGLEPVRVATVEASGNLFSVLGVPPQLGPGFPAAGPLHSTEQIAVISDRLWRTRYGADPGIVGRQLTSDGVPFTIVGVMPPGFHFPDDVDVWQRLDWDMARHSRHAHFMEAIARLAPGAELEEAQAAVDALAARLGRDHPDSNRGWGARLVPLLEDQLGYYRPALVVTFGAVGLLLLVGVLNVASLLLTRALSREREMAIRVAVGAARRHLLAQLVAESLVLSLAGAAAGLLLAAAALPAIQRLAPVDIPRLAEATLDWRALAVAAAVAGVTTLVFGLVPGFLLLRRRVAADLRSGERGSSRAVRGLYGALVTAELALACALLVSSGLLVRTVHRMTATPTGVDAEDVAIAALQVTREAATDAEQLWEGWRKVADTHAAVLEGLRTQPGVVAAGATNFLPLGEGWRSPFGFADEPLPENPDESPQVQMHSISDGYLAAMGARLVAGRDFTPADGPDAPGVVLVNETFARRFLAGRRPTGERLRVWMRAVGPLGANLKSAGQADPHQGTTFEIVGVVADVRNVPLGLAVEPAVYFGSRQFPFAEQHLAVRASDPRLAAQALRATMRTALPAVPLGEIATWGERFAAVTAEPRLLRGTLCAFATLAALLAAVGVYGMISWSVALRTRELAIRLTLGAQPRTVAWLILSRGAALVLLGVAIGLALVRLASAALDRVLFAVAPTDLTATLLASLVLAGAAVTACVPPVRRAMRVDPVDRLRAE